MSRLLILLALLGVAPGAMARQVNIGQRFAVQGLAPGGRHYTLIDRKTGRSAPRYGNQYEAKRYLAIIKGRALDLSGLQIGKVETTRLNQLGVRVGLHTGAHLGSAAFQLVDNKGWRKDGSIYRRLATLNNRQYELVFATATRGERSRTGVLYVMKRAGVKDRLGRALYGLADRLLGKKSFESRFVRPSRVVYSEAN